MIQIKTQVQTWYVKDVDEAYKVAFFLDSRGIEYDSNVIQCHPDVVHYSSINLRMN
jgi:hypothetical protein